ncbi:MAG: hypothetical protein V7K57_04780 [Nostoc sp.]|uniref:hypothetical protein n=1 Tax=Nostoc sp. TaxID=1180 RepID=UPI002FFB761B
MPTAGCAYALPEVQIVVLLSPNSADLGFWVNLSHAYENIVVFLNCHAKIELSY